jgi:hypothetical protein
MGAPWGVSRVFAARGGAVTLDAAEKNHVKSSDCSERMFFSEEKNQKTFMSPLLPRYQAMAG